VLGWALALVKAIPEQPVYGDGWSHPRLQKHPLDEYPTGVLLFLAFSCIIAVAHPPSVEGVTKSPLKGGFSLLNSPRTPS